MLVNMVEVEKLLRYNSSTNGAEENIISSTENTKSDTDEAEKCGKSEHIGKNHTKNKPRATTLLSTLPIIVLEMIFNRLDIVSIEHLYQADPYVEHTMDDLMSQSIDCPHVELCFASPLSPVFIHFVELLISFRFLERELFSGIFFSLDD